MLAEILVCSSPADRKVADEIAARLSHGAEASVLIDDGAGTVAGKWEGGLSSAAIVLVLSQSSVPGRVSREDWGDLLDHIAGNSTPPVACVLVSDCGYPRILERKNFHKWNGLETLRALERWALQLHQLPKERSFEPARLTWFEGRERELDLLWQALVDRSGLAILANDRPASGKTSLAQEFSRRAAAHFRDVVWIACGDRSSASIVSDLAEYAGVEPPSEPEEAFAHLLRTVGEHRVLVVFDDMRPGLDFPSEVELGRASVLVTSRSAVGTPIDAAPCAAAVIPDDPADLNLWRAMSVCRPTGFPVELAGRIAQIEPARLAAACARLMANRLADPVDDAGRLLRLNALSIHAAAESLTTERERHADAVFEAIAGWVKSPGRLDRRYVPEFMPAFRFAAESNWPLARVLGKRAFALLKACERTAEGVEMLMALRDAGDARGDWETADECSWELSWIRSVPYRGAPRAAGAGVQGSFDFGG